MAGGGGREGGRREGGRWKEGGGRERTYCKPIIVWQEEAGEKEEGGKREGGRREEGGRKEGGGREGEDLLHAFTVWQEEAGGGRRYPSMWQAPPLKKLRVN